MYLQELTTGLPSKLFTVCSLFILLVVLALCFYQWKYIRAYKHLPSVHFDIILLYQLLMRKYPKNVPMTSVLFSALINTIKWCQSKGLCVLWFFTPYVLVYNEEFSKVFFYEKDMNYKPAIYGITKEVFGNGLLGSTGDTWKNHRKLLNPAFYVCMLKRKIPIFNDNAFALAERLQSFEGKPTEDILDILKICSFNIISESVLGLNLDDEKYGQKCRRFMEVLDTAQEIATERLVRPWLFFHFLGQFFPYGRKALEALKTIRDFQHEVTEKLLKSVSLSEKDELYSDLNVDAKKSFGVILMKQHLQDPSFTIEDVRDHISNIIGASYDTVSITVMWCLHLLGHHPDVQEKAFKEILSVVPVGDVTYENILELKFLDCVIKETLRLYSTVPFYGRKTCKEIKFGEYTIPKNADILFVPFLLHRNPDIYPNPEKFDPERFLDSSAVRPWTYIPFAEGYRNCIGKKFAMMEMTVMLVHILRRFKITALNTVDDDSELKWIIILKPTKPLLMLFTDRQLHS